MKKHIMLSIICLFAAATASSQTINLVNDLNISESDSAEVVRRISEKVTDFQDAISIFAEKGKASHNAKMVRYNSTMKLFIGEGQPYPYKEIYQGNGYVDHTDKMHDAVKMGIIRSKYNMIHSQVPMTNYLKQLIRNSENPNYVYKKVVIQAADAVRVDNLTKVGEGRYMATAHILQKFMGYRADNLHIYQDYTAKSITIYINRIEKETPEGIQYYWEILLGDVDCDDIW